MSTSPPRKNDKSAGSAGADAEELLARLRTMSRIRAFEEQVARQFREGNVHGFVHTSIGQEAIAAGACAPLRQDDYITTTHRGHGHCLAKGADPEPMMAELFGRETGTCHGRGGSMHLADAGLGILGANGIVGAGIPLAVGAAMAARLRGDGRVAVAFFGEGAVHTGAFHEGMVLAVAMRAPVIFVCENNQYAEFTPSTGAWGGPGVVERASSYGMPAKSVDGNDVGAVEAAAGAAVASARSGAGPAFLEMRTYRMSGHYEGDAQPYRDDGEREEWAKRDPITSLRESLAALGQPTAIEAEAERAKEEMERAVDRALEAPYPDPGTVLEYVGWAEAPAEESSPRYIEAINAALADRMEADESVILMGVDIGRGGGAYGVTRGLFDRFGGERVIDTPIAEAGVLGAAVGAAMAGCRPVAEIMYMDFTAVCLDPIVNQAAKLRYMTGGGVSVPIVFRTQTGGGRSGGAQHSQSLEGMLAHVPGLHVYCPSDARDSYDLLSAGIQGDQPVCFVENRRLYGKRSAGWDREPLPPGVARTVRAGDDLTIVTWGRMVQETGAALDRLGDVAADLIDLRTLVPMDVDTVTTSVARTGRCLVVHEAVERFGPGGEVVSKIAEHALFDLDGPLARVGALPSPVPYSPGLEAAMLPGEDRIGKAITAVLEG